MATAGGGSVTGWSEVAAVREGGGDGGGRSPTGSSTGGVGGGGGGGASGGRGACSGLEALLSCLGMLEAGGFLRVCDGGRTFVCDDVMLIDQVCVVCGVWWSGGVEWSGVECIIPSWYCFV